MAVGCGNGDTAAADPVPAPVGKPDVVLQQIPPPRIVGHMAALGANACFGVGSVVIGLALGTISPMLFVTLRAGATAFIFISMGGFRVLPVRDWTLVVLYGCAMFVSMVGYVVGLKLSSPVMAAIWQPTQPIFALVVGVLLRIEWPSMLKCLGILLTFGGCAYIVLQRPKDESAADEGSPAVGSVAVNSIFILACIGSSSMVFAVKTLIGRGNSFAPVVGWASAVCTVLMLPAMYVSHSSKLSLDILCPVQSGGCGNGYVLPSGFVFPFLYVVLFMTVIPYFLNTVAAQALEGSVVAAYSAAQPVVSAATTIVVKSLLPDINLKLPHYSMIWGVMGIFAGLVLVGAASSNSKHLKKD